MNKYIRCVPLSLFAFISMPVFADWHIDVRHPRIVKISIERNVLTLFVNHQIPPHRLDQIIFPYHAIHLEDEAHKKIDHHGLGIEGKHYPHYHLAFEKMRYLNHESLKIILCQLHFESVQIDRIVQNYAQYIKNELEVLESLEPLRGEIPPLFDGEIPRFRSNADTRLLQMVRYTTRAVIILGVIWVGNKLWPI